jgi:MFS family permease
MLFSIFSWGTLITGIPGGILADRYGSKMFILCGITMSMICALLLPLSALYMPYIVTLMLRFIAGAAYASLFVASSNYNYTFSLGSHIASHQLVNIEVVLAN